MNTPSTCRGRVPHLSGRLYSVGVCAWELDLKSNQLLHLSESWFGEPSNPPGFHFVLRGDGSDRPRAKIIVNAVFA